MKPHSIEFREENQMSSRTTNTHLCNSDCHDTTDTETEFILAENHEYFLRFLARQLKDKEEATDVLQDFYVRVLTRVGDVRESHKLRAWMHRVLRTTLVDYYRKQAKRREIEAEYKSLEAIHPNGSQNLRSDLAACDCIYKLLPTLKPDYAFILQQVDLVGASRESAADALGITDGNLRVRLHRARLSLRKRLEETCRSCPVDGFLECACNPIPPAYSQEEQREERP